MFNVRRFALVVSLLFACIVMAEDSLVRETDYVGNVVGTVVDAETGASIPGAEVMLLDIPLPRLARTDHEEFAWQSNKGAFRIPRGTMPQEWTLLADENGRFLFSGIPTPFPYKPYTVIASAPGYDPAVVNYIPVLPGAVMALYVDFALTKGQQATVFDGSDEAAPVRYGHEKRTGRRTPVLYGEPEEAGDVAPVDRFDDETFVTAQGTSSRLSLRVYATQEGLIGGTTANLHKIKAGDNFVALPSRRVLCSKGGYEFQVQITYKNKTVTAPVWDVGPWNEKDDYWNPVAIREVWRDLPFGMPQAQAAYQKGHNGGKGRYEPVTNPAGIDLGSGTASALGFTHPLASDWVNVSYLWTTGNADFNVTVPSASFVVAQGARTSIPVTFSTVDGLYAYVKTAVSDKLPKGVTATFKDSSIRPPLNGKATNSLEVAAGASTPVGLYTFTVSGTVGARVKSATVTLKVDAPPPLGVACSASPNPVKINRQVTWSASASGGSGSFTYSWYNGTTTKSYSKSYSSPQTVSNWVVVTDKQTKQSKKATCSLTVTK